MKLSGVELYAALEDTSNMLDITLENEWEAGIALAAAEEKYQVAVTQEALKQKDAGNNATFINSFIRGVDEIARLRKERDIAEVKYKTFQDKANALKLQLRIINEQISREWAGRASDSL